MLFKTLFRFYWMLMDMCLRKFDIQLQFVIIAAQSFDVMIFFFFKFCLMSSLTFTLPDVTSFLRNNTSDFFFAFTLFFFCFIFSLSYFVFSLTVCFQLLYWVLFLHNFNEKHFFYHTTFLNHHIPATASGHIILL